MIESGVEAIQMAARGLEDINEGLQQLRDTLQQTFERNGDVAGKLIRISKKLSTEIADVEQGIATERRQLVGARNQMHVEEKATCY